MVRTEYPPTAEHQQARGLWLRLGGAFTALALVVACFYVATRIARGGEHTYRTYPAQPGRLTIDLAGGGLGLKPGLPGQIAVEMELTWALAKPRVVQSYEGGTLRVRLMCPTGVAGCHASLTVSVPPDTPVQAESASGNVNASDLTGDVNLLAHSGDVRILNSVGRVDVISESGDVDVTGAASRVVNVRSDSGDVFVACERPPTSVVAKTTSGNVLVTVPAGSHYRLIRDTMSGTKSGTVNDFPAAAGSITATTTSGDVAVSYS